MSHRSGFAAACLVALVFAAPAHALITRLTPLKAVIDDSDQILVGTVEAVDPARPSMTLSITQDLKGTLANRRVPVLLEGGPEGNPKQVLDRIKPGTELVLFITVRPEQWMVNAFTEGSWFQILAPIVDGTPRWRFTHGEPYLRRTFKGTTQEMKSTIAGYLNEKKAPPGPVADEKPGFGPTLDGVAFEAWTPKGTETGKDSTAAEKKDSSNSTPAKKDDTTPAPSTSAVAPAPASSGATPWVIGAVVATVVIVLVAIVLRKKAA